MKSKNCKWSMVYNLEGRRGICPKIPPKICKRPMGKNDVRATPEGAVILIGVAVGVLQMMKDG